MDAEAGYLANAEKVLRLDKTVDLFLLNERHFPLSQVVCHLIYRIRLAQPDKRGLCPG
jgi:hypothetical protein